MRARAPASSANLGPGFDALAVALALYVEVEVAEADRLSIVAEGEGSHLPRDDGHLAAQVVRTVAGHDRFRIAVRSEIPVARGLGSSAALAAAAAAAAGAPDPLGVAAEVDGHPENAAASVLGGLVAAASVDDRPVARRLALDEELSFVVVVPDRELSTKQARAALPARVSHEDAAFNLGRLALLVAGLSDHEAFVAAAAEDRLHQPYRTPLFRESERIMSLLIGGGALAASWSGAGPSLLAVTTRAAAGAVVEAGTNALSETNVAGRVLTVDADRQGLVVG